MEETLYTFSFASIDALENIAQNLKDAGAIADGGIVEGFAVHRQIGYWRGVYEQGYTVTLVGPRDEAYRGRVVLAVQNIVKALGEKSAILYEQHLPYESVAVYADTTGPALGVQVEPVEQADPLGRPAHKGYPGDVEVS